MHEVKEIREQFHPMQLEWKAIEDKLVESSNNTVRRLKKIWQEKVDSLNLN
jgi:FtsZ-binding cell division protein ZapB